MKKLCLIIILLFLISFPLKAKEVHFTCDCKRQTHMYIIPNNQNPQIRIHDIACFLQKLVQFH